MSSTGTVRRELTPTEPWVRRIEAASFLDPVAGTVGRAVRGVLSTGKRKDALSGTWLGHPLHPMLTDVVIGSFTSASVLDLLGGEDNDRASRRLIVMGIAAYLPTALTGVNDWADTEDYNAPVRRAGLVHAASNAAGVWLYVASLRSRRRGSALTGKLLGVAGMSVMMAGGYLGGHLSLRKGVGVDQTAFDPGPTEWSPVADSSLVPDRRLTRMFVGDTPVLLLREDDRFFAIHDRCSHRGCSLSDGEIDGDEIICACHGSRFDRRDGSVTRGPATAPQPAFQVRQQDGRLEIRRLSPGTV